MITLTGVLLVWFVGYLATMCICLFIGGFGGDDIMWCTLWPICIFVFLATVIETSMKQRKMSIEAKKKTLMINISELMRG